MHDVAGGELPLELARIRVEGVEFGVAAADVDEAVDDSGGRQDPAVGSKSPFHAMELPRAVAVVNAGMREVAAEHMLSDCRRRQRRGEQEYEYAVHEVPR